MKRPAANTSADDLARFEKKWGQKPIALSRLYIACDRDERANGWQGCNHALELRTTFPNKGRMDSYQTRLAFDAQCYPLPTSPNIGRTNIVHPIHNRHLSVVEYARFFSVREYQFPILMPAANRYGILGNGNPPTLLGRS